jgi:hypothetical protein
MIHFVQVLRTTRCMNDAAGVHAALSRRVDADRSTIDSRYGTGFAWRGIIRLGPFIAGCSNAARPRALAGRKRSQIHLPLFSLRKGIRAQQL